MFLNELSSAFNRTDSADLPVTILLIPVHARVVQNVLKIITDTLQVRMRFTYLLTYTNKHANILNSST